MPRNKKTAFRASQGFTLIELLVVISLISFMASIIIVTTVRARRGASDARQYANLKTLQKALELYRQDNGGYPPINAQIILSTQSAWQTALGASLKPYLPTMPGNEYVSTNVTNGPVGPMTIYTGPIFYATMGLAPNLSSIGFNVTGSSGTHQVCVGRPGYVIGVWEQQETKFMNTNNMMGDGANNYDNYNLVLYGGTVVEPYSGAGGC